MGLPVIEVDDGQRVNPTQLTGEAREFGLLVMRSLPPALKAVLGSSEDPARVTIGVPVTEGRSLMFSPKYVFGFG